MPSITPGSIEGGEVAALESAVIARAMVTYTQGMEKPDENGQAERYYSSRRSRS